MDVLVLQLRVEATHYALPLSRVVEVALRVRVHAVPELPSPLLGFVSYRGRPIPAIDVRARLGHLGAPPSLSDHLIVAHTARREVALLCDRVLGFAEVSESELVPAPRSTAHVAGVVSAGPDLLFIADLDAFLSLEEDRAVARALRQGAGR